MKKQIISTLLVSILVFLMIPVGVVFGAGVGDPLPQPEEGWQRIKPINENFTYEGEPWTVSENAAKSKWQTSNSAIKFNFVGSKIRYIIHTWDTFSNDITIKIDGKEVQKVTSFGKNDTTLRIAFEALELEFKEHSVEIINNKREYLVSLGIDIDDDGEMKPFNPIETETPNPEPEEPQEPEEPEQPKGDRAILVVTMTTGLEKEYDLSMDEVNAFIAWYDAKDAGAGPSKYAIDKHNNNKGPFSKRADYVIFNNILTFEVNEYKIK